MKLWSVSEKEREMSRLLLKRGGDGKGADVAGLDVLQTNFADPTNGNVVLLVWNESSSNAPDGVMVVVDGLLLGSLPEPPGATFPRDNFVFITNLSSGTHNFLVAGGGTQSGPIDQLVLDAQPFGDVTNLICKEGGRDPATGDCEIVCTWTIPNPAPDVYAILLDGAFQGTVQGFRELLVLSAPPGHHCLVVIGFLTTAEGRYRGEFIEACLDTVCADLPCNPPGSLTLCQVAYGPGNQDNAVSAAWTNGESPYAIGVNGFVDGNPVGQVPGDSETATFGLLAPGQHTIGIQGDCGALNGQSTTTEAKITLLTQTPHTQPTTGDIICTFDPAGPSTTAMWTNASPSVFIDVYVFRDPNLLFVGNIAGDSTDVNVAPTEPGDVIALQFFTSQNGMCYGSDILGCTFPPPPGNAYIQAVCNGVGGTPQITSAIFVFNFLFLGGGPPPCKKACDANGDGSLNISDGIAILNYLFLGGRAPTLWVDSNSDGNPDPTCSTGLPAPLDPAELPCESANPACPL